MIQFVAGWSEGRMPHKQSLSIIASEINKQIEELEKTFGTVVYVQPFEEYWDGLRAVRSITVMVRFNQGGEK